MTIRYIVHLWIYEIYFLQCDCVTQYVHVENNLEQ